MIVLADNDVVHKLVCCDLLNELLIWLESPPNEVWVLPELRYKIGQLLKHNTIALARFNSFLQSTKDLPPANIDTLEQFSTLDVGERQLIAVFVDNTDDMKIVTGDKRAIKQIASLAAHNVTLKNRLEGNVDCLEGIMIGLINHFGFEPINNKVVNYLEVDGVFKQAFGRSESHALDALNSYLNNLRSEAPFIKIR